MLHHPAVVLCMIAMTLLSLAVLPAGAQLDVVDTRLDVVTNPFLAAGNQWKGDPVTAYLYVAVCHDAGGFSPQDGAFVIAVARTTEAPAWVDVSLREETQRVALPFGPELEPGCTEPAEFEILMQAVDEVAWSTSFALDFSVEASREGEAGTYALPPAGSARLSIETIEDPAEDIIKKLDEGGLGNRSEEVEEQTPAPALLPVALFFALAVHHLRRRNK
jgi:hypothetical protein